MSTYLDLGFSKFWLLLGVVLNSVRGQLGGQLRNLGARCRSNRGILTRLRTGRTDIHSALLQVDNTVRILRRRLTGTRARADPTSVPSKRRSIK